MSLVHVGVGDDGGGVDGIAGGAGDAITALHGETRVALDFADLERKLYLGGYRDKRSGLEYLHAATQTPVERVSKWAGKAPRFTRETQTTEVSTRSAQTYREAAVQTKRHDLYMDTTGDVARASRPYFTADELMAVKETRALTIQCHWRGHLARARAARIRSEIAAQRAAAEEEEARKAKAAEAAKAADVSRRMHPRTMDDFSVLYDEVESWRVAETAAIKSAHAGDDRKQKEELAKLLARETALLGTIERLRSTASKEAAEDNVTAMLARMAAPKRWSVHDGGVAAVHTPYTTRAQELQVLYAGLVAADAPVSERLELLTHVRETVAEFDCPLTREVIGLVDREMDMLHRGRPPASFAGSRQRLKGLFLTFCETPAFNPEAAKFRKMPEGVEPVAPSLLDTVTYTEKAAAKAAKLAGVVPPGARRRTSSGIVGGGGGGGGGGRPATDGTEGGGADFSGLIMGGGV